jgi:hypothetical protein
MMRKTIRVAASVGLLALGLLIIPAIAAGEGVKAPEAEPAGGRIGPIMSLLVAVNQSALLRLAIFLMLSAAAAVVMFWRRVGDRGSALLIVIDGLAVLWIALQMWGIFSAVVGE